jgi:hypothetical protein
MKQLLLAALLAVSTTSGFGCSSSSSTPAETGGAAGGPAQTGGSASNGVQGGGTATGGQQSTGGASSNSTKALGVPGDPCTADSQCTGLTSLTGVCMTNWPGGGYCATSACVSTATCADLGWCADDGTGTNRCLQACTISSSCRAGYSCPKEGCVPSS